MMKIIEQSPNKLILRQNRLSLPRLFWELFLTGIGLAFLLWFGPARLDCQRIIPTQVTCRLSKPGWLGIGIWRDRTISNLQSVKLVSVADRGGEHDGMYDRILLQTSHGEIPLRSYKTSGLDNNKESSDRLQNFLNDSTVNRSNIIQVDWLQWLGLVLGVFFSLIGLRLLRFSLSSSQSKAIESYDFDRVRSRLTYQYGGLLRKERRHYLFSDIHQFILDTDSWAKARLFLEMRSGELLCLNGQVYPAGKSLWEGVEWRQLQSIADEVSRQIDLPWKLAIGFGQPWMQQQLSQNRYAKAYSRFYKSSLESSQFWVFDRANRSLDRQNGQTIRTYNFQDIIDLQVTPSETPTPQKDSDGDIFYDVNYQIDLVLTSGELLIIRYFFDRQYDWNPSLDKWSIAQTRAEETAKCIRQFIGLNGTSIV